MNISVPSDLETKLRARAEAEGLSAEAYLERLIRMGLEAEDELEGLALEGLNSGDPAEGDQTYWAEKHRWLDERLKTTGPQ